jgi:aerotaxis receptor
LEHGQRIFLLGVKTDIANILLIFMINNSSVSSREYMLADDVLIMSLTDPQSHIVYVNLDFIEASGFERSELTGQPHNMVRHPDMPSEAFTDMWQTIQDGESWVGLVKNRRKNGEHYWVRANATPIEHNGRITGYTSVRVKPSRQEVEAAQALYQDIREGRAGGIRLHKGLVVRRGLLACMSAFQLMPMRWRMRLAVLLAVLVTVLGSLAAAMGGSRSGWRCRCWEASGRWRAVRCWSGRSRRPWTRSCRRRAAPRVASLAKETA